MATDDITEQIDGGPMAAVAAKGNIKPKTRGVQQLRKGQHLCFKRADHDNFLNKLNEQFADVKNNKKEQPDGFRCPPSFSEF